MPLICKPLPMKQVCSHTPATQHTSTFIWLPTHYEAQSIIMISVNGRQLPWGVSSLLPVDLEELDISIQRGCGQSRAIRGEHCVHDRLRKKRKKQQRIFKLYINRHEHTKYVARAEPSGENTASMIG